MNRSPIPSPVNGEPNVDSDDETDVEVQPGYAGVCYQCRRRARGLPGGPPHTCWRARRNRAREWRVVHSLLQQALQDIASVGGA